MATKQQQDLWEQYRQYGQQAQQAAGSGVAPKWAAPITTPVQQTKTAPNIPGWLEGWLGGGMPVQSELAQIYAQQQQQPWWQDILGLGGPTVEKGQAGYGQVVAGYGPAVGLAGSGLGGAAAGAEAQALMGQLGLAGKGAGAATTIAKTASKIPGWLGALGRFPKAHPWLTAAGLAGAGYLGYSNLAPEAGGQATPVSWTEGALSLPSQAPTPSAVLPQPGSMGGGELPYIVGVGGQQFWYDPGTGSWNILPEQQGGQADELTMLREQIANQQYLAQMENQSALEQIRQQYELQRQLQSAGAAQDMATMYAQDPYKYWAQMGQLTPEAVARLTGGEVQAGQPFKGTPLSYPSMQWWANLLPSEQQQILGVLNWMGINPEDWQAIQQRMIPGLGSRQMEPVWAR